MTADRVGYSTAISVAESDRSVGHFVVQGLVTPEVSLQILETNRRWVERGGLCAQVVYYERAAMLIDAEAMMHNAARVLHRGDGLTVPTALVVTADMLPLFERYSTLMAQHGVLRVAFTSRDLADAWAREEAAVHAAAVEALRRHHPVAAAAALAPAVDEAPVARRRMPSP